MVVESLEEFTCSECLTPVNLSRGHRVLCASPGLEDAVHTRGAFISALNGDAARMCREPCYRTVELLSLCQERSEIGFAEWRDEFGYFAVERQREADHRVERRG